MKIMYLFVHNKVVTCFTHSPCGIEYFSTVLETTQLFQHKQGSVQYNQLIFYLFKNIQVFKINKVYKIHASICTVSAS